MEDLTSHTSSSPMHVTFYFGKNFTLLFRPLHVTDTRGLVGAIIAVFLAALFYEGLKTVRELLLYYDGKRYVYNDRKIQTQDEKIPLITRGTSTATECHTYRSKAVRMLYLYLNWLHALQSFLHVVQVGWAYILMLVAMTFNGWLFLSVCCGAGVGYFIFARFRVWIPGMNNRDRNEHCN